VAYTIERIVAEQGRIVDSLFVGTVGLMIVGMLGRKRGWCRLAVVREIVVAVVVEELETWMFVHFRW
jgi:hypothetical protein